MIQNILFFYKMFKLYVVLVYAFAFNNSLAMKIKNLDGHMAKNWSSIEIQFKI